jgi:hypothetical protein
LLQTQAAWILSSPSKAQRRRAKKQKPNKKMKTLSKKTITAVAKYGKEFCIWAAQENKDGNGANTISWSFPKDSGLQGKTRSADAAINAGYELLNN